MLKYLVINSLSSIVQNSVTKLFMIIPIHLWNHFLNPPGLFLQKLAHPTGPGFAIPNPLSNHVLGGVHQHEWFSYQSHTYSLKYKKHILPTKEIRIYFFLAQRFIAFILPNKPYCRCKAEPILHTSNDIRLIHVVSFSQ